MNQLWEPILDHEKNKEILNTIFESRRVPHAFLFYGQEGIGKFFTAIQFAKLFYSGLPENQRETVLKKISLLQEPYVKLVMPLPRGKGETGDDTATEKLSVEQIESIQEQIRIKISNPYHKIFIDNANTIKINSIRDLKKFTDLSFEEVPFRFIIILEAQLMNDQAQNAILKTLEEPPEGIYIFLLTNDKNNLLPTIQSRCWQMDFEPLSKQAIISLLTQYYGIDEIKAKKLASFSDGSITQAIGLSDQDFEILLDKIIAFLRFSIGKKYQSAYNELNEFLNTSSKNEIVLFLRLIKNWLNDAVKEKHNGNHFYFSGYEDTFSKFNRKFANADLNSVFDKMDFLEKNYEKNLNLNVLILNIIFELASLSSRNE